MEKGWKVLSLDVSTTFLPGDYIGRDVCMIPLKEFILTKPEEDRDKTMTIMWDAVTQTKEFGFAVGQDDYIKKVSNSDAQLQG